MKSMVPITHERGSMSTRKEDYALSVSWSWTLKKDNAPSSQRTARSTSQSKIRTASPNLGCLSREMVLAATDAPPTPLAEE